MRNIVPRRRAVTISPSASRLPPPAFRALLVAVLGIVWAPAVSAATCEIPAAVAPERVQAATAPTNSTPAAGPAVIQIEREVTAATPGSQPATPIAATPTQPTPDPLVSLTAELTAVSEALAACLSSGDAAATTQLAGERYLGQLFGSSVPLPADEYIALVTGLTPVPTRIVAVEEVAREGEDGATAVVTQVVGNQLLRAEWLFEPAPRGERAADQLSWRLAVERRLATPAPEDAASIAVEIGDRSFTLDEASVSGGDVVLRGRNVSAEDHEMLVLRFAAGYTTADLLRAAGPDLPQSVTYAGELPVPAGDEAELVLVDLEPGIYTIVCLFPDSQGVPHLAQGMEASFTVE